MADGKDIFGNPVGTDSQGNNNDQNSQGNRKKDIFGNDPKDTHGNESGSEAE